MGTESKVSAEGKIDISRAPCPPALLLTIWLSRRRGYSQKEGEVPRPGRGVTLSEEAGAKCRIPVPQNC